MTALPPLRDILNNTPVNAVDVEFYLQNRGYRHSYCKPCSVAKSAARYASLNLEGKTRVARMAKASHFGMSLVEFDRMVANRTSDLCDICGKPDTTHRNTRWTRSLCIDHDRATRRVRGFLCSSCNIGLGNFMDDPALLRAAASYLESTVDLRKE